MNRIIERAFGWAACATAALLVAALMAARADAAACLRADNAVVRLAAVPGRPAAGYLTLSGGPATLTGVASPLASRIEMHSSSMAGGVMPMDALPAVMVPAAGTVSLAPGGSHLMIYGLPALKPGASVPLTLRFAEGQTLQVTARAVAPGAARRARCRCMAHIERGLTPGERALADAMFAGTLETGAVRLHRAKWFMFQPAWVTMAPDGGIWFHPNGGLWCDDFAAAVLPWRALFVHELTHVWQHQQGINLVLRRRPFAPYRYRLGGGRAFGAYGIEQQAMIVENAYRAREAGRADPVLEALLPFAPRPADRVA